MSRGRVRDRRVQVQRGKRCIMKKKFRRDCSGRKTRQFRHFRKCEVLFKNLDKKTVVKKPPCYSLDYLVNYCNTRWGQWTSDTTDELCRIIQENATDPTELNRLKLSQIEQFSGQMYAVRTIIDL